ncbi:MAG: Rieske 2Fe-2S domain-containing protein, partial [Pigmentiphaga sp.]|uniref:Rieske 2Fe-2S domain-containing protein n=1 Tax=Pigmentiphaga sp. TaxID=1977564 RepID=UPI0029BD4259
MSGQPSITVAGWPTDGSFRVPYDMFVNAELFEQEQAMLFRGPTWNFVAMELEIPNPGDYKTGFIGDTPVVTVRDHDGSIHCVVNRCAHRGATLCYDQRGNKQDFTCVYHNWRYDLTGQL